MVPPELSVAIKNWIHGESGEKLLLWGRDDQGWLSLSTHLPAPVAASRGEASDDLDSCAQLRDVENGYLRLSRVSFTALTS